MSLTVYFAYLYGSQDTEVNLRSVEIFISDVSVILFSDLQLKFKLKY